VKKAALLAAMIAAAALCGCDETDPLAQDEEFILAVMVLDAEGRPLEGMSVGREIELEGFDVFGGSMRAREETRTDADSMMFSYPNPFDGVATVRFTAAGAREAALRVTDWRGREIDRILEGRLNGGQYSVSWDQRDSQGLRVIEGVYRFVLSMTDTLEQHLYSFSDSIECTVVDFLDPYRAAFGVTDITGFLSTRDLDLFPSLQGHAPQTIYDPLGDPGGRFSISDTVTIRVSTPAPAGGGWIYHMSRRVILSDGPNYLEFHFLPDDSTETAGKGR
jgi:hypothetical protein